jgi:hypothetical protein
MHLQAWALHHRLKPSRRFACGHSLLGSMDPDVHRQLCIGERVDLLNHASLWNRDGRPAVLVAWCYRPATDDLGYASWAYRLNWYATRLRLAWLVPLAVEPIHSLYARDTTAVLYGPRGLDLAPFVALPLGLSPDLDHTITMLAHVQAAKRKQMAREREARALRQATNPKPLSASATFRAEHGDEVRGLYAVGDVTQKQLAARFGTSTGRIQSAIRAES